MPGFDVRSFLGIAPMMGKENLPNEAAQVAVNCRLEGTDMEPWNAPLPLITLTSIQPVLTIYRYGMNLPSETTFWFQWAVDADVVKGPVASDTEERTYWTEAGSFPKKTKSNIATVAAPYPSNFLRMGIPIPATAPTVTISGVITAPDDPKTTAAWGYTYVSSWGEEGPMSPLSSVQTWGTGQTPHLAGMSAGPAGAYQITAKRIYRSNTGTNLTELQFVIELPIGTTSYDDTVLSSALGGTSITRLFTPPPDDLQGLCEMANEILVGFTGNTVRMCEPGIPYAWPERYSYTFNSPVVGVKGFGQSVLVCCQRGTYILSGVDPSNMAQETVVGAGECVSKRGMVCLIGGVAYPTKLGLQYVGPDGVRLLSDGVFDEAKWAVYKPESFVGAAINNRYLAFFDTGVKQGSILFSSVDPQNWVELNLWGTALWTEKGTQRLYMVRNSVDIQRWDGGAPLTVLWHSKAYRFPIRCSMGWASVEADTYPVTFRLYGNGALLHTETVTDAYAFVVSTNDDEFNVYEFEVEGSTRFTHVRCATTMAELKRL